ncbi:MAG TPA: DALR anticodon-binding domain-containing protein [Trebonia sp.]
MITAEVRRAIWDSARDAAADGELPPITQKADTSSLRPVPDKRPGRYASTLPYQLAGHTPPNRIAATLAARLRGLPWIAEAEAAPQGYLTLSVTEDALAALAVRITEAGPAACARSDILRGTMRLAARRLEPAELATAASWADARDRLAAEVSAELARAAGAKIVQEFSSERLPAKVSPARKPDPRIADALAFAGSDVVRYALLRMTPGVPAESTAAGRRFAAGVEGGVRNHLDNPVYAVRYAHAHAASTLRQAADLGIVAGEAVEFRPRLLAHTAERALLGALSWLPERVAGAARRGQPRELARYLEELAGAYHDDRENCPALPFGGRGAPRDGGTMDARLWLVSAARTAIAAGLALLGVSAPDRL